jgi:hypothetical protein
MQVAMAIPILGKVNRGGFFTAFWQHFSIRNWEVL